MSRVQQLSKLFKALADEDLKKADGIATEIAVDEEKKGHHSAAQLLKGSLHPNSRRKGVDSSNGIYEHTKVLSNALTPINNPVRIKDVMLNGRARAEIAEIVREWKYSKHLASLKIRIRNRLFFYGPPGCGKSLTAQALGQEISLPTYVVRFDAIIGAYLGQTALHLRQLFHFAEQTPCVLVFDEVDALAKQRGNPLDVGELDRIVISFMQELEHAQTKGIIIATSNLPNHLDKALWRRFDLAMEFRQPKTGDLKEFVRLEAKRYRTDLSSAQINHFAKAKSYAEAEKLVESVVRAIAIKNIEKSSWQKKKTK